MSSGSNLADFIYYYQLWFSN